MSRGDLAGRLRHLRTEKGLTQQQLAEPAYTPAYISTIEAGKRFPSDAAVSHFAGKLGISVRELKTGVPSSLEPEISLRVQQGWQELFAGRFVDADRAFRAAEKDAARLEGSNLRARALVGRARTAERQGKTDDARSFFNAALKEFDRAGPYSARAEAVAGLAKCYQMAGEPRRAAHILETFVLELERQNLLDPAALMRAYASLVWPYMELGLESKAAEAAHEALRLQPNVEDPEVIAGMHVNVARSLLNEGHVQDALESLQKAEELYSGLNWKTEIARAKMARGMVHVAADERNAASDELRAALETFEEVGFVREEARVLNELARLERLSDRHDAARDLARRAVELLSEMEAVSELALAHRELALSLRPTASQDAEKHFRRAIELYEGCGERLNAADTHRLLGDLLTSQKSAAACEEYRRGLLLVADVVDRRDE